MAETGWEVVFDDAFLEEFTALDEDVQDKILARAGLLKQFGPQLPGPMPTRLPARPIRT
jgi:hypothetical protein